MFNSLSNKVDKLTLDKVLCGDKVDLFIDVIYNKYLDKDLPSYYSPEEIEQMSTLINSTNRVEFINMEVLRSKDNYLDIIAKIHTMLTALYNKNLFSYDALNDINIARLLLNGMLSKDNIELKMLCLGSMVLLLEEYKSYSDCNVLEKYMTELNGYLDRVIEDAKSDKYISVLSSYEPKDVVSFLLPSLISSMFSYYKMLINKGYRYIMEDLVEVIDRAAEYNVFRDRVREKMCMEKIYKVYLAGKDGPYSGDCTYANIKDRVVLDSMMQIIRVMELLLNEINKVASRIKSDNK